MTVTELMGKSKYPKNEKRAALWDYTAIERIIALAHIKNDLCKIVTASLTTHCMDQAKVHLKKEWTGICSSKGFNKSFLPEAQ